MIITAARDIEAGEELSTSYIHSFEPISTKDEQLEKFNFQC